MSNPIDEVCDECGARPGDLCKPGCAVGMAEGLCEDSREMATSIARLTAELAEARAERDKAYAERNASEEYGCAAREEIVRLRSPLVALGVARAKYRKYNSMAYARWPREGFQAKDAVEAAEKAVRELADRLAEEGEGT